MAAPIEVVRDSDIFAQHNSLVAQRKNLEVLSQNIQTGKTQDKTVVERIVRDMQKTIRELITKIEYVIIPKDVFSDFVDGDITLDQYASDDILSYYNELRKYLFGLNSILVAIFDIKNVQPRAIVPEFSDNSTMDIVDLREFDGSGEIPTSTLQPAFSRYIVRGGDTLQIIANRRLGDYSRWTEIARANNITDSDLLDGSYVGKAIKIPIPNTTITQSAFNMVFELPVSTLDPKSVEKFFYGTDIAVVNGRIVLQGSDYMLVSGKDTIRQNLEHRLNGSKGGLTPMDPGWGLVKPKFRQGVPPLIALDRFLSDAESQAASDPRVVAATIDRTQVTLDGDAIRYTIRIQLLAGEFMQIEKDI